ncbi:MAG: hypothetical protein A3F14_07035 [Gammaproteobacteria bacterium RIFCSPHIGHO2_12_FULL_43_28]|nr:MAG: hypothetical protein A3F14_07035 [Gammaproteobacteria bacterium RIFCSPHIGHO2_12_FULL_43_28]
MRNLILLLTLLLTLTTANAESVNGFQFTNPQDADRFTALTQEVRCVVCQSQSIADSNAPLAKDLQTKIYQLIVQKKSDQDINDYLVKRYGEFILLRPRFNHLTYFLWFFPLIALCLAFLVLYRLTQPTASSNAS